MADSRGPAWQAVKEASGLLLHWSSAVFAVAVVVVAHWLAAGGTTGDRAGLVFGASFAVFALLLPAIAILREYADRRTARLSEVLAAAGELDAQRQLFGRLAKVVKPLQRGIVLAVLAALASAVAIVAPGLIVWHHAPGFLVFSLADLLTGLALVCLIATVVTLFPFTWHLLISSDQLKLVERALGLQAQPAQPTAGAAQPAQSCEPSQPPVGTESHAADEATGPAASGQ